MDALELPPLYVMLAVWSSAQGAVNLKDHPGCWERSVDERWWVAANGHSTPTPCSRGGEPIPPYSFYIEFNGWPAGIVGPGGGVVAAGELANEETLRAALGVPTTQTDLF